MGECYCVRFVSFGNDKNGFVVGMEMITVTMLEAMPSVYEKQTRKLKIGRLLVESKTVLVVIFIYLERYRPLQ